MRERSVAARAHPTRPQPLLNPSLTPMGREYSPDAADAELRLRAPVTAISSAGNVVVIPPPQVLRAGSD